MKILVTGAVGFIGSHVVQALLSSGHTVLGAVRDVARAKRRFPAVQFIACDFNHDVDPRVWEPRLQGVDAVVNCVGILQSDKHQDIDTIHFKTPAALFAACKKVGIKKIIQISAQGAASDSPTAYGRSKYAAETCLAKLELDAVVLRPSLVYETGSSGGVALFRSLAGLPFFVPLIGAGQQAFQPIYVKDLAHAVVQLLEQLMQGVTVFDAVTKKVWTMRGLLARLRDWLGIKKARFLKIPVSWMALSAKLTDFTGSGPMPTTALKMLMSTAPANGRKFSERLDFKLQELDDVLQKHPAEQQDVWHARSFFFKPILQFSLVLLWILTGIFSLTVSYDLCRFILTNAGWSVDWASFVTIAGGCLNIVLGLLMCFRRFLVLSCVLQIAVTVLYSILATFLVGSLWLNPFAPLLKNIPLVVATFILMLKA